MLRLSLVLLALSVPASAQVFRDKAGNPVAHTEQLGNRTYLRDNAGNPLGYSERKSNGTIEYRDKKGDPIGTQTRH